MKHYSRGESALNIPIFNDSSFPSRERYILNDRNYALAASTSQDGVLPFVGNQKATESDCKGDPLKDEHSLPRKRQ